MKLLYFIIIICFLFIHDLRSQSIKTELDTVVTQMEKCGILEPLLLNEIPDTNSYYPQNNRYVFLYNNVKDEELWKLTKHKSPIVKYYSLVVLTQRKAKDILDTLLDNLQDTTEINELGGDVGAWWELNYLIETRLLPFLLSRLSPNEIGYNKIKPLIYDTRTKSSIITLARFKKAEDLQILKRRLWFREDLNYTLRAVIENPVIEYQSTLQNIFNEVLESECNYWTFHTRDRNLIYNAIASYQSDWALSLFQKARKEISKKDRKNVDILILSSIYRYPSKIYDVLIKQIAPNDFMIDSAKRLMKDYANY